MHVNNIDKTKIFKVVITRYTTFTKIQFYKKIDNADHCFFEKNSSLEELQNEFKFKILGIDSFDTSNLIDKECNIYFENTIPKRIQIL
jgi:hypothetical protein